MSLSRMTNYINGNLKARKQNGVDIRITPPICDHNKSTEHFPGLPMGT